MPPTSNKLIGPQVSESLMNSHQVLHTTPRRIMRRGGGGGLSTIAHFECNYSEVYFSTVGYKAEMFPLAPASRIWSRFKIGMKNDSCYQKVLVSRGQSAPSQPEAEVRVDSTGRWSRHTLPKRPVTLSAFTESRSSAPFPTLRGNWRSGFRTVPRDRHTGLSPFPKCGHGT